MDWACPKELAIEILSDSDHSIKVAPTTLNLQLFFLLASNFTYAHFQSFLLISLLFQISNEEPNSEDSLPLLSRTFKV